MNATNILDRSDRTRADYDRDLYAWAFEQAALLREGRFDEVDIANIADELESLGRSEFRSYASAYRVLLLHILKWDHQPERRSRSWWASIAVQRDRIGYILTDNPSLKSRTEEAIARGYREARLIASDETELPLRRFPELCPYDPKSILDRPFDQD